jgi:uncharacterized protein (TIGR02996 family)
VTDEAAFQAALDKNPADHALRLVFADWLEEHADWRAAGYRHMGTHQRVPQWYMRHRSAVPDWNWRSQGDDDLAPAVVPELFPLIDGHQAHTDVWKEYATRQEAEEALCRAVLKHDSADVRE